MTEPVAFSVGGAPRGKGRPRATVQGGFARFYTDDKTRRYEAGIAKVAKLAMVGREPFSGPLSVSLRFRLQPPKSMTKHERAAILAGEEAYMGRIDIDNAVKAICDAVNGICWVDDVQIVRLFATKAAAERPGIDIKI